MNVQYAATFSPGAFDFVCFSNVGLSTAVVRVGLAVGSRLLQPRRYLAANLGVVVIEKVHSPVDDFSVQAVTRFPSGTGFSASRQSRSFAGWSQQACAAIRRGFWCQALRRLGHEGER